MGSFSSGMERSDEEVAKQVQEGNAEAFGTLVERYEEKMLQYGRRFLLKSEDAKDLVQEVFLKAYANIRGFDTGRKFSSWLYRIAHNEFVNGIKKKFGRETLSLFDFDVLFPHLTAREDPDQDFEKKELKKVLDTSLGTISSKYREVLVLYYYEEMDYREIAEVLQIPVSTVGVRLRRGKESLKKSLKKQPSLI